VLFAINQIFDEHDVKIELVFKLFYIVFWCCIAGEREKGGICCKLDLLKRVEIKLEQMDFCHGWNLIR
jgi:hypothetical protein